MKSVGKPDARNGHVRFDERGWETGRRFGVSARAQPRLYAQGAGPIASAISHELTWSRRIYTIIDFHQDGYVRFLGGGLNLREQELLENRLKQLEKAAFSV